MWFQWCGNNQSYKTLSNECPETELGLNVPYPWNSALSKWSLLITRFFVILYQSRNNSVTNKPVLT